MMGQLGDFPGPSIHPHPHFGRPKDMEAVAYVSSLYVSFCYFKFVLTRGSTERHNRFVCSDRHDVRLPGVTEVTWNKI